MQKLKREGLSLLFKLGRAIAESEDSTEEPEEVSVPAEDIKEEPMKAYWESDKEEYRKKNQPFIDLFLKDVALERIPDTTEKPVKESHYSYDTLSRVYLPEVLKNFNANKGVPDTSSKAGSGISSSGRDASVVAGIVVAVISGVIILGALIAVVMYRHYVHRNVTSMNFDNPVYRKTTENQFALEQNGYAPGSKLYPSTVGEESQEPLNTPGTNDFV